MHLHPRHPGTARIARLLLLLLLPAWGCGADAEPLSDPTAGLEALDAETLAEHIRVLSSDAFEGRFPATRGEELTLAYLTETFQALGLEPGNRGSYLQEVPLVEITADPQTTLRFTRGAEGTPALPALTYAEEFMAWTRREDREVELADSELVFAGYGIVAPEYDWNDYEGLDVRGRTVVVLVNDPGFATGDPALFNGRAMTYYGRWTYKFEEAARQGAAAALIVHETEPAGYPWSVVAGSWSGPRLSLAGGAGEDRLAVEGWVATGAAADLLAAVGLDLEDLKRQAAAPGFRPLPLDLRVSTLLRSEVRRSASHNVLALLRGAERPEEVIVYTAHWDHLGRDGDQIYNGARDNASGTAALLELARAFRALPEPPGRSILFLAVTAEEQGLLGSAYYAANPVFPTARTVAAINMDALNIWGPMRDITVIGYGNSELDDDLRAAAAQEARIVRPEPQPELGYFYRSDHFSFAQVGIPALYTDSGVDHVDHGEAWTLARRAEWTASHYHQPSDVMDESWDLRGMVDDLRLFLRVGHRLAQESRFPAWAEGSEFRAVREADLGAEP